MPPVTGYISISFTPNFVGQHRICWRIGNVGPYTCEPDFTCNTDPCTYYITPVSLNNDSCDTVDFNGYIQAACEEEGTLDGAVFWSQAFVPNPECQPYQLTCLGQEINSGISITSITATSNIAFNPQPSNAAFIECMCNKGVLINTNLLTPPISLTDTTFLPSDSSICGIWNGLDKEASCYKSGRGYNACDPFATPLGCSGVNPCYPFYCECLYKPGLTFSAPPPGGIQATGEFILGYGGIRNSSFLSIVNSGSGNPALTQTFTNVYNTNLTILPQGFPGFGKQQFDVTVTNGQVTNVVPKDNPPGYYFIDGETFSFAPASIGGVTGVVCQVKPFGTDFGFIKGIQITNPGSGYISPPTLSSTVTICGRTVTVNFNAVVNIDETIVNPCPPFFPGDGCVPFTNELPIIPELPVGSQFTLCYPVRAIPPSVTIPREYDIVAEEGCCYDCVSVQVASPTTNYPTITYTNCDTKQVTVFVMSSSSITLSCAVNNSWVSTDPDTVFTVLGSCIS